MGRATTIFSAIFLAIGGFLFGYDSGIITSTIALPTFIAYFGKPSDTTTGGIVSAFMGGAILGTIINMFAADWLGRRRTIFVGAAVSCLGASLQAGATTIPMVIVGRFIGGVAVGMLTSTIPLYAAELSEAQFRGVLSGLLQWMLSWGFLVAQWLGYGCSFVSSSFSCQSPLPQCEYVSVTNSIFRALSPCFPERAESHSSRRNLLPQ
jgi:MFS family permease